MKKSLQAWGEEESFPNEGPKVKEVRFFVEFLLKIVARNGWQSLSHMTLSDGNEPASENS